MKRFSKNFHKGFTLIELLVVIVIIGILATLATVGLNSVRAKARDSKRISDIRQMQSALELYFNDNNAYPTNGDFVIGTALDSPDGSRTYMSKIPSNPKPWAEGACASVGAEYNYSYTNANSYQLSYCLANNVNDITAGVATAVPGSIAKKCISDCTSSNRCAGATDNCGGTCASNAPAVAPATVTLTASSGQMVITWSAVPGATSYTLYGNTSGSNSVLYTGTNLTYTNTSLTNGTTYYYTVAATICGTLSSKSTQVSKAAGIDFSTECNASNVAGDACGGGWLICTPTDGNCLESPGKYVVAAPTDSATSQSYSNSVAACAGANFSGFTGWTLPKMGTSVATFSGDLVKNEICQIGKRSNKCANMNRSGGCSGGCLSPAPITGTYALYDYVYWASNDSGSAAWSLYVLTGTWQGLEDVVGYSNPSYARCVRRF